MSTFRIFAGKVVDGRFAGTVVGDRRTRNGHGRLARTRVAHRDRAHQPFAREAAVGEVLGTFAVVVAVPVTGGFVVEGGFCSVAVTVTMNDPGVV